MNDYIELVRDGYRRRQQIVEVFFSQEAERLSALCHLMAERFARGGRLVAFGVGAAATDAQHVSVEFVHPVIVGKRALPALALPNDVPTALGSASEDITSLFARSLRTLGGPEDISLGMIHSSGDSGRDAVALALKESSALGMLTICLGGARDAPGDADFVFEVPSDDPFVVQELHETLYHLLWELVHVFFEHKGLLKERPRGHAHDAGQSSWLYPFLAETETNLDAVLDDVGRSIVKKTNDLSSMRRTSCDADGLVETGRLIADRLADGGKILAFGNGGSATDAQDLVFDLMAPPGDMPPIPAISLTNDAAVLTAVGNDVGFENVFSRQVIAYGKPDDVAVAISTSGGSRNVLAAITEARRQGLLTVGLAGYGGGRIAEICDRDHVIAADYIPRIQEAQATQYHLLRAILGAMSFSA